MRKYKLDTREFTFDLSYNKYLATGNIKHYDRMVINILFVKKKDLEDYFFDLCCKYWSKNF